MTVKSSHTILIVDDVPMNIRSLAEGLKDEYSIQVASNGKRALEIATSDTPPDLILLDIIMPDLDGFAVCSRLKSDDRTQNIPVIFITSMETRESEVRGLEIGAVDYITKPFVLPVVKARLHVHLELKRKSDLLEKLALLDGLTEIHNRRFFEQTLDKEWRRNLRRQSPLSLIMSDIDLFKKFNDRYGHTAGDRCLRQVAQAMKRTIRRAGDMVTRYGGEEFAVLLPETNIEQASRMAEAIRQAVFNIHIPHAATPSGFATLSLGVATRVPDTKTSPVALIDAADEMLYRAKKTGRNRVAF